MAPLTARATHPSVPPPDSAIATPAAERRLSATPAPRAYAGSAAMQRGKRICAACADRQRSRHARSRCPALRASPEEGAEGGSCHASTPPACAPQAVAAGDDTHMVRRRPPCAAATGGGSVARAAPRRNALQPQRGVLHTAAFIRSRCRLQRGRSSERHRPRRGPRAVPGSPPLIFAMSLSRCLFPRQRSHAARRQQRRNRPAATPPMRHTFADARYEAPQRFARLPSPTLFFTPAADAIAIIRRHRCRAATCRRFFVTYAPDAAAFARSAQSDAVFPTCQQVGTGSGGGCLCLA